MSLSGVLTSFHIVLIGWESVRVRCDGQRAEIASQIKQEQFVRDVHGHQSG
jgi:hypothetical protein